jgi:hypothetical protein
MLSGPVHSETDEIRLLRNVVCQPTGGLTLERIPDEEDGEIQTDDIVIPILGVKLGSESSRVSSGIGVLSLNGIESVHLISQTPPLVIEFQ